MKQKFKWLLALIALVASVNLMAETVSLTLKSGTLFGTSSGSTLKQNNVTWKATTTSGAIQNQWNGSYHGQQFGDKNTAWVGTFSTSDISGTITSVKVDANTGGSAKLSVKVGTTDFKYNSATTVSVTKNSSANNATWYEFTGSASGDVIISFSETSKAAYFGGVTVTYSEKTTVYFDLNGGTGTKPANITDFSSATLPSTTGFTKTGYRPNGWNTESDGSGERHNDGAEFPEPEKSVTLYVDWMPVYTMTYDGNNKTSGSVPSDSKSPYDENSSVTVLGNTGNLARTGYTWSGWNTKSDGTGTTYQAESTFDITSNTTLFAKWTANKYNLTFDKNDATAGGSMDPQEFTFNVAQNLNSNTFTAPAHKYFTGWATTPSGSVAYTNGANYKMTTEGATLYAVWAWNKTTITLNPQEGSGGTSSVTATYGQAMPTLSTIPSRNGYEFAGYYSEPNGAGTRYYNADKSSAATWLSDDKNATLYAYWTPKTISVTFNKNGHGEADGSATIVYNTSSWETSTFVTASTGYTLNGYFTSSSNGSKVVNVDGTLVPSVSGYTDSEGKWIRYSSPVDLYAQYTPINYPVTWMVSGEQWTKDGSENADYDAKISAVPTAPTTSDCDFMKVFVGWTATPIAGTTNTRPSDLFTDVAGAPTIKGDATYYAVFALPEESATDYAKGTLADLQTGKKVLILSGYTSEAALSSEVGAGGDGYLKIENVTITNNIISNPINTIIWNVTKNNGKYRFDQGASKTLNLTTDDKLYANGNVDEWTIALYSNSTSYQMTSTVNAASNYKYFDLFGSTSGFGCYSSSSSNKVDFYLPATTYSEYATTCVECTTVITISKGEEVEHGSYSLSKTGEVCLSNIPEGTYSVTVTATPDEHYHLATVNTTSGVAGEVVDNTCVVSGITANTTLTAVFEEDPKVTVTWHIGAGSQETEGVYVGSTYSLLTPPDVDDDAAGDCADKFMGWATDAISTPTDAAGFEAIQVSDDIVISESQKDFYAVFAEVVGSTSSNYTITFATSATGNTPISTSTQASAFIAENSRTYVTSTPATNITKAYYGDNKTSIRVGKSGEAGTITLTLSENGQVKADKIVVNTYLYSSTKAATLSVNNSTGKSIPASAGDLEYSLDGSLLTEITLATSQYAFINSLTVYYEDKEYGNYITQCCTPWTPSLSYTSYTMQVGDEQDAVVGTTHGAATYTSNNPSSVEVNESTGHIKAVGGGTATISVTWAGDDTYCEQSTSSQEITVNGSLQVSFNGNGADGGTAMEPQSVEYGVETKINKNTYTKTGYTFSGWNTDKDATSILYTDEQSVAFTAGVELFAIWRINAHNVTVQNATGGTIAISPTTTTINYGTTVTATATLATGYNFVTWSATPSVVTFAEATNKSTTFSMPDADITLTASYTPILVTQIDLKKGTDVVTALEFEKGVTDPVTLTTAFTPADALVKTVNWQSDNTEVVTVDNGVLTAQGLGTAVVTATSTVVPTVAGSVSVTVYEWQDADPKYTLTNQPTSTVYYETNKIDFANWTIKHNFKRSDDATKTKQETVASSDWTVTLGDVAITDQYTLTTVDNGKALVIKVGETILYNETLTVNEKAKHTYIDRVHGNETKVMIDGYTIPALSNAAAATEGDCATTHYVFKGWVAEANADAPSDDNLIAAGGSATAEADATFYAVWAERRNVTEDRTMSYGWEVGESKTGWTVSGSTSSSARTGSKSGSVSGGQSASWTDCIKTSSTIAKPKSITCYYSKDNTNTNNNSYWAIEIKTSASGNWQEIQKGNTYNDVTKNQWYELSADLTSYTNIIVGVNAKTTASDRLIDDVVLTYEVTEAKDVDYITECVTRYELTFDANGATAGKTPATIMLKEGGKVALPNADLIKAYNDFNGWNTNAEGTGIHYDVNAEYTMGAEDAVLYADWTPRAVESLEITTEATTKEFGIGQTFSSEGLKVKANYIGGETETNVDFTTNFDGHAFTESETGTPEVIVSYKGATTTYNILVAPALIVRFFVNGTQIQEKAVFDKKIGAMPNAMTSDAWTNPENEFIASHYPVFAGWTLATDDENIEFVNEGTSITTDVNVNAAFAYSATPDLDNKTLATSIDPSKRYVIVDGDYYYNGEANNDWGVVAETKAEVLTFYGKSAPYAIQQTDGKYFKVPSSHKFYLQDDPAYNFQLATVESEYFLQVTTTNEYLRDNAANSVNCLRWYGTGTGSATYLYSVEVTYDHLTIAPKGDHVRSGLTYDKAGTICLPYAVKADDYKGASVWSIESRVGSEDMIYAITLVEEVDGGGNKKDLEAGKPYIFFAEESEFQLFYSGDEYTGSESVWANGLIGNLNVDDIVINAGGYQPGSYLINQNKLMECGANCYVGQYRAYVQANLIGAGEPIHAPMMAPRRVIGNPNVAPTRIDNLNEDAWVNMNGAHKFFLDGNIVIMNEGKLYNAQGIRVQ